LKAVLFDARGRVPDQASRDYRQIHPQAGWVEHAAEKAWRTVFMFDRPTCRPLHNALVWRDRRGETGAVIFLVRAA
jgi:glycerol kinase